MSAEQHKATIHRWFAAFERRDIAGIREPLAPGFVYHEPSAPGGVITGEQALEGTHRGTFMGAAPSGRRARTGGIVVHHLAGGRIAEYWGSFDALGLLRQLGAIPAVQPAGN